MKIKAMFFDIDGTLISKNRPYIQQSVIDVLHKLQALDIKLFIATGRHLLELEELKLKEQFEFDGYILLNGGLCIYNDKVIYENAIDKQDADKIIKSVSDNHFATLFIEKDRIYVNFINDALIQAQQSINTSIPPISSTIYSDKLIQIDPYVSDVQMQIIMEDVKNCKYTKWHDEAFDIVPKTGGKKAGIEAVLKYLNLSKDECVSFGDGENDIEMFECTGMSFAMENANEDVKKHATHVCGHVDDKGIILALEQIGLLDMLSKP